MPQIEDLRKIVQEKDDLVSVLTERLELAAEQLDRLRRQGGPLEPAANSSHSDFDDPGLSTDLRQMLADWQELQERGWFGALETRLEGIHGLVSQLKSDGIHASSDDARPKSVAEVLARHGYDANAVTEDRIPVEVNAPPPAESENIVAPEGLQLPEQPPAVDIQNGSINELREGLRQRDDYIGRLKDYLLAMEAANQLPTPSPDLGPLTGGQQGAIETWEASIRKEIRQTQIQLWIERAQLSREQMKIRHMQHHLETETRRLGLAKQRGAKSGTEETPPPATPQKGKGWMGMFGG